MTTGLRPMGRVRNVLSVRPRGCTADEPQAEQHNGFFPWSMAKWMVPRSRSPVLLRISTPLAGERALCEVAKTATLAAHHSHSVDCKAERVRPGKCGNDTPIVSSASWCRLKTVTRYGRRT